MLSGPAAGEVALTPERMSPLPVLDVPAPRHGGGYDRSRRRKRVVAGVATPSARAHRRRQVPRYTVCREVLGRTASARAYRHREVFGRAVRGDRVSRSVPGEDFGALREIGLEAGEPLVSLTSNPTHHHGSTP